MIIIPKKIKVKQFRTKRYKHYELVEDKCTSRLLVYRCIENGCLETWSKKDFEERHLKYLKKGGKKNDNSMQ